jgi:hypothetical protein
MTAPGTKRKCSLKAQMSVVEQTWLAIAATSELDPSATSARSITPPKRVQKSPGRCRGFKVGWRWGVTSVPRDGRATKAVVDAHGNQINVLTDRVGAEYSAGRGQNASRYEGDVAVTHEKVIVLDRK